VHAKAEEVQIPTSLQDPKIYSQVMSLPGAVLISTHTSSCFTTMSQPPVSLQTAQYQKRMLQRRFKSFEVKPTYAHLSDNDICFILSIKLDGRCKCEYLQPGNHSSDPPEAAICRHQ
jgi:hypothetical protein